MNSNTTSPKTNLKTAAASSSPNSPGNTGSSPFSRLTSPPQSYFREISASGFEPMGNIKSGSSSSALPYQQSMNGQRPTVSDTEHIGLSKGQMNGASGAVIQGQSTHPLPDNMSKGDLFGPTSLLSPPAYLQEMPKYDPSMESGVAAIVQQGQFPEGPQVQYFQQSPNVINTQPPPIAMSSAYGSGAIRPNPTIGLALGILAIVCGCNLPCGIPAIILASMALSKVNRSMSEARSARKMSAWALALGLVGLTLALINLIWWIIYIILCTTGWSAQETTFNGEVEGTVMFNNSYSYPTCNYYSYYWYLPNEYSQGCKSNQNFNISSSANCYCVSSNSTGTSKYWCCLASHYSCYINGVGYSASTCCNRCGADYTY